METKHFISRDRQLPPSQDFHFLVKSGLEYVERLGSKFWTDYNAHDPGVTILEVLCYAITELGYRSDFNIQDLLTGQNGYINNKTFFTAAEIYTNAALTGNDYRKLLMDTDGISNAWLIPNKNEINSDGYWLPNDAETKIFINRKDDILSLKNTGSSGKKIPQLQLRGLNRIKIELDEHPDFGDLNSLLMNFAFWGKDHWVTCKIIPQFTDWSDPRAGFFTTMNKPGEISVNNVKKVGDTVFILVHRYTKPEQELHFRIFADDPSETDLILNHFKTEKPVTEFISLFADKKIKIEEILAQVSSKLHKNRGLGEDYLCVEIIGKINIGICADIELIPSADAIDAMSKIQITIDNIINPKINFYTLNQLVEDGIHAEDIFSGPKLMHGFLKDSELERAQLLKEIHASDIIAVLMEIPEVLSVKNLMMTAYSLLGKPITGATNEKWVLKLSGEEKPVFDVKRSKLLLFQKNIPFLLNETQQMLADQKVTLNKSRVQHRKLNGISKDFEIGSGEYFEVNKYYSIQNDFPAAYGLGKNKISDKETPLRKAQAKQLQGYLYFYEQILSDFFNQLYNAGSLLNTETIHQTYFPASLETDDFTGKDFYSKAIFSSDRKKVIDSNFSGAATEILYETETSFSDRRNRALDHLLARFAESFNEYVFTMYQITQSTSSHLSFDCKDIISDKQNFLADYPEISSNRGLGIDYWNADSENDFQPFWKTDHRGGYEKRVARLLGINHIGLRNIVTEDSQQKQWTVETESGSFLFKIVNPASDLEAKWNWSQLNFLDQNIYKTDFFSGNYYLYLKDRTRKMARLEKKFETEQQAYDYLVLLISILNNYYENFFCLEHILLRPFNVAYFTDEELLSVCLNDGCSSEANDDPYSFKTTVVLPGYLSRFRNLIFRKFAEKVFRQEAPAHILLKICWVNPEDMLEFQKTYRSWLEVYRDYRKKFCSHKLKQEDEKNYVKKLGDLVKALKKLNTIYPEGNLYDCHISETKNPVILGSTSLGTL
ncbi:hypothetical protein ASG31_03995 [Chryseobacterium sp. Leaf404]|uniref:hypothetical protein n=1 Tax=unclassified Chryseobacterium TaxID=2593645 RepID=UPI0006F7D814|nr:MULTISPECIES: hypothetical protein [unclassified Chryseobacterium]KQT17909.1 hypothetical protein ASG31_03995 [Chryseobacterium sp. Leaf404]